MLQEELEWFDQKSELKNTLLFLSVPRKSIVVELFCSRFFLRLESKLSSISTIFSRFSPRRRERNAPENGLSGPRKYFVDMQTSVTPPHYNIEVNSSGQAEISRVTATDEK